jgi:hypothetical protein
MKERSIDVDTVSIAGGMPMPSGISIFSISRYSFC